MAVHIVTDSTCDLTQELTERFRVTVLPLFVTLNDAEYRDGVTIHAADVFRAVEMGAPLPKTAAVPVSDYADCFRSLREEDPEAEIVCIAISAKFSSCYQNACIAAADFQNVYVVDSMNLSTGIGLIVLEAAELAQEGRAGAEIAEHLQKNVIPYVDASFIVDRLDYLRKGGRCSAVAALGANLLKLKPCIAVKDGAMGVAKKYRGTFVHCVTEYVREQLADRGSIRSKRIFITHAGASGEAVKAAADAITEAGGFSEVLVTQAGCTISCHCGPNTLGVLFIRQQEEEEL